VVVPALEFLIHNRSSCSEGYSVDVQGLPVRDRGQPPLGNPRWSAAWSAAGYRAPQG